jgi:hypothetical protein
MKELVDQLLDLAHKAADAPRKWIGLQAAREHVLRVILWKRRRPSSKPEWDDAVRAMRGEPTTTEGGRLFAMADRHARDFLVRAFAAGDVRTRGVQQTPGQQQVMHEPIPLHWWKRTVDGPGVVSVGDEYPVHALSWTAGTIHRRNAGQRFHEVALAVVTDIEIDRVQLLKAARPLARTDEDGRPSEQQARDWLIAELKRRKKTGEPHKRDIMVRAIRGQFPGLFATVAATRRFISKTPTEFRAKGGPRPRKPGPN